MANSRTEKGIVACIMAFMLPTKPGSMPMGPIMGRMGPIPPPPGGPPIMPTPISGPIGPIGLMPGRSGGPPIMPRGTGPGGPPPPPPAALTSFMAAHGDMLSDRESKVPNRDHEVRFRLLP